MMIPIQGLATAQPERLIAQADAAEIAGRFMVGTERQLKALPALFRRTQVARRASVLLEPSPGGGPRQSFYPPPLSSEDHGPSTACRMERYAREAPALALAAARKSLDAADCRAERITHLVTASCTGFFAPGVDFALIRHLGLRPTVGRTHIGFMGCHAALNGLRVVQALAASDPSALVLLAAVELCSLHYQYGCDADHVVANALFADGAAALVAGLSLHDSPASWRLAACGSCLIPDAEDAMSWRIGDHGFTMTLSPRVPDLIARHLRPWLEPWLGEQGLSIGGVGSWAVHPGGPRILTSVAESLALPAGALDASAEILATCGNMSSPTILFVLKRLEEIAAPRPCVALAFGPGLVAEAALLR